LALEGGEGSASRPGRTARGLARYKLDLVGVQEVSWVKNGAL